MTSRLGLTAATLAAAILGAALFRSQHVPLAAILGSLTGTALVVNTLGIMPGGIILRRSGQLYVGASVGAVLTPEVISQLARLLPLMVAIAVASNVVGLALAFPLARLAGIDRLSAVLASLPAGMAEMASLAHALKADETAVALIHTLRVILVLTLLPLGLGITRHALPLPIFPGDWHGISTILALVVAAALIATMATRLRILNAFVIVPMLLCLIIAAAGHELPPVPRPVIVTAQIGIGASIGLRLQLTRLRRLPRIALAGGMFGIAMIAAAFLLLRPLTRWLGGLDPVSATLAVAPGGLAEMIGSAASLGLLAAAVAGFQLTRSLVTNLGAPPLIRWVVTRNRRLESSRR